jgi:hypothetical protein
VTDSPLEPYGDWINCVVDIADREAERGDPHITSHWVFIRKVLDEPRWDAFRMAVAFRHVRLDHATCVRVADGWADE